MKTEPNQQTEPSRSPSQQRFSDALRRPEAKEAKERVTPGQGPLPGGRTSGTAVSGKLPVAVGIHARASAKALVAAGDRTANTLQEARGKHEATAETLVVRREELGERVYRGAEERLLERVSLELEPERGRGGAANAEQGPKSVPSAAQESRGGPSGVTAQTTAATQPPARSSAASAVELVQKIEVWVKSSRPTLSMTVGGTLEAEVTVERTGPGRVSLSLRGTKGPPAHSDVRALRESLEARGLQLTSVQLC